MVFTGTELTSKRGRTWRTFQSGQTYGAVLDLSDRLVCSLSCFDLLHYSEELGWAPVVSCQVTDIWIPRVGLDLKEP